MSTSVTLGTRASLGVLAIEREALNALIFVSLSIFAFKACLDAAFALLIRDVFADVFAQHFVEAVPITNMVASYGLMLAVGLPIAFTFRRHRDPSSVSLIVIFVFLIAPLLTLFGFGSPLAQPTFILAACGSLLVSLWASRNVPVPAFPALDASVLRGALILAAVASLYVYGALIASGALGRFNLNFYSVYDVREYTSLDESRIPMLAYLVTWQAHVINIGLLSFGLYRRSWVSIGAACALEVLLFGLTNYKSFVLAPALAVGVYYLAAKPRFFSYMLWSAVLTIGLSFAIYSLTNEVMIPSVFVRRLFFGAADNHLLYYEYFSQPNHPFVMLSNSVLKYVFSYPYREPVKSLIAAEYMGGIGSPNVGYLGDAYFHFGIPGMIGFSFIFGAFLRVVNRMAARVPLSMASAIIAMPVMSLVNSGLFTTLLTHGFLPAAATVWMLDVGARKSDSEHAPAPSGA